MDLAQFKGIFWWEWAHRLIARVIGLALALPFLWFLIRRRIPPGYGWRLAGLASLVMLQAVIGWWMVSSGLVNQPEVAHQLLALHLCTALLLLAALVWTALDLRALGRGETKVDGRPKGWIIPFMVVLFVQYILGAFLAGLQGGHVDNTWPMMEGGWFPHSTHDMSPMWTNAVNNPMGVQFLHRWWAVVVALFALWVAAKLYRAGARKHALALELVVLVQFTLGVLTLVNHDPIALAIVHQGVGSFVLFVTMFAAHWAAGGARAADGATITAWQSATT
ncbi:MAG: COX15/CtaA family protein [Actinobacteria bacterium]|nr:COX15/CtaA family protein [Actinomycetota bacterium]